MAYAFAALIIAASCREARSPGVTHQRCKVVGMGTSEKKLNALLQQHGGPLLLVDEAVLVCPCGPAAAEKETSSPPSTSGGCGCGANNNRSTPVTATTTPKEGGGYGGSTESGKYGGSTEGGKYGGSTEGGKYGGSTEGGKYGGSTEGPKVDDIGCYPRADCSRYAVTGNRPIAFYDGDLWEPSGRCVGR